MRKPDRHPRVFAECDALAVGQSFVLLSNHEPRHLREEFDADRPGEFDWEYLELGTGALADPDHSPHLDGAAPGLVRYA